MKIKCLDRRNGVYYLNREIASSFGLCTFLVADSIVFDFAEYLADVCCNDREAMKFSTFDFEGAPVFNALSQYSLTNLLFENSSNHFVIKSKNRTFFFFKSMENDYFIAFFEPSLLNSVYEKFVEIYGYQLSVEKNLVFSPLSDEENGLEEIWKYYLLS